MTILYLFRISCIIRATNFGITKFLIFAILKIDVRNGKLLVITGILVSRFSGSVVIAGVRSSNARKSVCHWYIVKK